MKVTRAPNRPAPCGPASPTALAPIAVGAALTLAAALAPAARAQVFQYADFTSTTGLALLGAAAPSGPALRLTANAANQSGWVWRQTQVDVSYGFTTTFAFRIAPSTIGPGGEGLVFALHADPGGAVATGGTAWGLGYGVGANGATGLRNSLVLELDTYRDLFLGDTSANELSLHTRGAQANSELEQWSLARATPATNLADGTVHTLTVRYSLPGTIEVSVDGAATPALLRAWNHTTGGLYANGAPVAGLGLPAGMAFVGFAATTGAGTLTQLVELQSWSWESTSPRPPCYSGTLLADTLTVAGAAGGPLRTVRLATAQAFDIGIASPPAFGPGAPYVLFASLAPQPGVLGTQLGFGETCFPVLPLGPAEFVLADAFGLWPGLLPAAPTPHVFSLPAGTVSFPLDFTLQAVTLASASPLAFGVTNAVDVEVRVGPAPTIQTVAPLSAAVGQPITVTGQNFVPGVVVAIGGAPVATSSASPTQLVFAYPAGVPCGSQLAVVNPDGQAATAPFNPQPVITGTLLGSGTAAGNQVFIVQGTGFSPGTTVTIGGAPATVLTVSATSVTMRTPPGMPGVAPVVLTTPGGCTATTTYTYL